MNEAIVKALVANQMALEERLVEGMLALWPWPAGEPSLLYDHRHQLIGLCPAETKIGDVPKIFVSVEDVIDQ